jgi:hypothetical protein
VAIVQISRITQRKGLESDLPQPLAGAEFGWAIDQRRLFIGNGDLVDGAPVVGNTEVLTEFSDILSFATEYTYKGEAAGYTVQTGPTTSSPVSQSIQSRLDSYAVITDFGATGDGVTDVTLDINRALYQIFCRGQTTQVRRSLFFPAGTYVITDTLDIPPYCKLYGEGADSTIIYLNVQNWTSTVSYTDNILVYYDGTGGYADPGYYRANFPVPVGTLINATTSSGDYYWGNINNNDPSGLPEYMLQTADSLQQTGVNIATNNALPPGNIEISGIKFKTNRNVSGVLLEKSPECFFDSVSFEGASTQASLNTAGAGTAGVTATGTGTLMVRHITFNNCSFSNMSYGVNLDEDHIESVTFSNCEFDTLYNGVNLSLLLGQTTGPTGVRITTSVFDNIYAEGIVINDVSRNISAYNTFYDVGDSFLGVGLPATSIINIDGNNNVSVGDMFQRNNAQSTTYPRIKLNNTNTIAMSMNSHNVQYYYDTATTDTPANTLDLGNYQVAASMRDIINESTTANLVVIPRWTGAGSTGLSSFKMDYTIKRDVYTRRGAITVMQNYNGSGAGFTYVDDYQENGSTGTTLAVTDNLTGCTISYTCTAGIDGTIDYTITNLG